MSRTYNVLTRSNVRAYYDRFGSKQDKQGFYEDPALDDLVAHADLGRARSIFEFGCGTGKFAERILTASVRPSASYLGCDLSPTMIGLATQRLASYAPRAMVSLSNGDICFPISDQSVDRVISNYVLDLLSEEDARRFFDEAHRVLAPGGKLCLASLTDGVTLVSRLISWLWMSVFRLRASLVGGCRPVQLQGYMDGDRWQLGYKNTVIAFGVASEVLVLVRK